jgi:DNA-directed RNA polymerase subunit RPC12/RpoP
MTTDDTTSKARKRWLEAARAIAEEAGAEVTCPACGEAHLTVRDSAPVDGKKERTLACGKCGARVFIRMEA